MKQHVSQLESSAFQMLFRPESLARLHLVSVHSGGRGLDAAGEIVELWLKDGQFCDAGHHHILRSYGMYISDL